MLNMVLCVRVCVLSAQLLSLRDQAKVLFLLYLVLQGNCVLCLPVDLIGIVLCFPFLSMFLCFLYKDILIFDELDLGFEACAQLLKLHGTNFPLTDIDVGENILADI